MPRGSAPRAVPSRRILYLGENWYGSCARACAQALRRLGAEVVDVDIQTYLPQLPRRRARAALRLATPWLIREYNRAIQELAAFHDPEMLVAFKGAQVRPETLAHLGARRMALYNFFPDPSAFAYGPWLPRSLPLYDCVFYTKPFWERDVRMRIPLQASVFLRHGYDPEIHRPARLDESDVTRYGCDIALVATHTPHKEEVATGLVREMADLDLRIWGNGWRERCRSAVLHPFIRGIALTGQGYAKQIGAARINLAVMSGRVAGASQGDETSTRTYEIPACGGFMLHERSAELAELFTEGVEVACFGSVAELVAKVRHYLRSSAEREAIARAGHRRCVPAYSYDARMTCLLAWHEENGPGARSSPPDRGPARTRP